MTDSAQKGMSVFHDGQGKAEAIIAETMTKALAMWWAPVVSGVACSLAESEMIRKLFRAHLSRDPSESEQDAIEHHFRKKYLIVNVATFVPWVGPAIQVLEVYALGKFASACLSGHGEAGISTAWMDSKWQAIEPEIWAADKVVAFYEKNSGSKFPENIRPEFIKAVDFVAGAVQGINSVPGLAAAQEIGAEVVRDVSKGAKKLWKDFFG